MIGELAKTNSAEAAAVSAGAGEKNLSQYPNQIYYNKDELNLQHQPKYKER
jgi:hypothetical protein